MGARRTPPAGDKSDSWHDALGTINVQGSVVTERELADLVAKYQDRNMRLRYKLAAA
jgi:hypothetical protein